MTDNAQMFDLSEHESCEKKNRNGAFHKWAKEIAVIQQGSVKIATNKLFRSIKPSPTRQPLEGRGFRV